MFYVSFISGGKKNEFKLRSLKVKVLVVQSCLTLCNSMNCSLLGSSFHGILQQEYWSGLSFPSPGDLPDPGIEPRPPASEADFLPSKPLGNPTSGLWVQCYFYYSTKLEFLAVLYYFSWVILIFTASLYVGNKWDTHTFLFLLRTVFPFSNSLWFPTQTRLFPLSFDLLGSRKAWEVLAIWTQAYSCLCCCQWVLGLGGTWDRVWFHPFSLQMRKLHP